MNTQDFKPFIKSWEEIYALQGELQLIYRPRCMRSNMFSQKRDAE